MLFFIYFWWAGGYNIAIDIRVLFFSISITEHQLLRVCQFLTSQVIEYTTQLPDPSPSLNYRNQLITEFATLIYDLISDEAEYARATIIKDALLYPIIDGMYIYIYI